MNAEDKDLSLRAWINAEERLDAFLQGALAEGVVVDQAILDKYQGLMDEIEQARSHYMRAVRGSN